MNLQEARNIMGVEEGAKEEDVKKKYRELTKKFHPDINKDDGAEEKFKKINEAYECVKTGRGSDSVPSGFKGPHSGIHYSDFNNHPFRTNPFKQQRTIRVEPVQERISISFKDAVWGCKRDVTLKRKAKCNNCNGTGDIAINNGCNVCGGTGMFTKQHGNMVFSQTCKNCMGKFDVTACTNCSGQGMLDNASSIQITVPPGIQNGNVLRLEGMGHYIGDMMGFQQRTDAHIIVSVIPEPGFSVNGIDIVTNLQISLIDALKGCKKSVKTLIGQKEIEIKPKTRNNDEVSIPGIGVGRKGSQKVILDVVYPENVDEIINILEEK